jgi:hypothetical protein
MGRLTSKQVPEAARVPDIRKLVEAVADGVNDTEPLMERVGLHATACRLLHGCGPHSQMDHREAEEPGCYCVGQKLAQDRPRDCGGIRGGSDVDSRF